MSGDVSAAVEWLRGRAAPAKDSFCDVGDLVAPAKTMVPNGYVVGIVSDVNRRTATMRVLWAPGAHTWHWADDVQLINSRAR